MRFRRAPLFALLGCFLSIAMGFPGSVAWGISSGRVLLPLSRNSTQSFSRQSGISLAVDTAWVGIHGYRPVFCTVTRQVTPSKSDMQIRLRFKAGRWRTNKPAIIVEQEFELPAGDTTGTFSFLVPQYVDWRFFACETWVDGVKDKELCVDEASYASDQSANNFSALLIGDGRDFRIRRLFNDIRGTPAEVLRAASLDQFDTWLKYSPLDVVATTTARLEALASTESTHFAELLKWVRTGGNLWVFASGEDYRDLARIEAVLDIAPNLKDKTSSKDQMIARGWRFPLVNDPTRSPIDSFNQLSDATDNSDLQKTEQDNAGLDEPAQVSDSYKWFAAQLCGFGTVVVFPFPAGQRRDSESTSWAIAQSLVSDRISWDMRHGVNSGLGNENFNDFLIPEVGFAPVFAFQFLLSLFVLAIGPQSSNGGR